MTHDYFKDYREAHDEMIDDEELGGLKTKLAQLTVLIEQAEASYRARLRKAEEGIHAITLDQQRTLFFHGIEAKYKKPIKSTSWKNVAMNFKPSKKLIEEYSKVGSPSVRITIHEVLDLED